MAAKAEQLATMLSLIGSVRKPGQRTLVAVAGAPGAGKSTLAAELVAVLVRRDGAATAELVPMDGFHLDNDVLEQQGLLSVKGAPHTFDVEGFKKLVEEIRQSDGPVSYPLFDRTLDRTIPDGAQLSADVQTVVFEGNYLLLGKGAWAELKPFFDASIMLSVPLEVLRDRLVKRWLDHGLQPADAVTRAEGNDLVNARTVIEHSALADLIIEWADPGSAAGN